MSARPRRPMARGGRLATLAVWAALGCAAGTAHAAPGACPRINVAAGDGDLLALLQRAAEASGFTLHYAAQPRRVSGFQGVFTPAEFIARLGREAGLVVQYRRLAGCPEDASIARLWVLPTQRPPQSQAAPPPPAVAAAPVTRPSLAEEAALKRRQQEDAENHAYVNQN